MQGLNKVTAVSMVVIFTLLILPATVLGAGEPRLRLLAETLSLTVGQQTTLKVLVEDVAPIYGAEAHLTFDPTKLEVVDVQHGDFLSANPDTEAFVLQKQADNTAGTVDYALSLLNPAPPAAGNGLLMQITIKAKAEGPANIKFDNGLFGTQTGQEILPIIENIEINIVTGANSHQTSPDITSDSPVENNAIQQLRPVAHQPNQVKTTQNTSSNTLLGLSLLFGAGMIGLVGLVGLVLMIGGWLWINRTRTTKNSYRNHTANQHTTTR